METLPFSKMYQFQILSNALRSAKDRGSLAGEAIDKYCLGRIGKFAGLFNITKSEYLEWARKQPISEFVSTSESTFDGDYLLEQEGSWILFVQERGVAVWKKTFASYEDAIECAVRAMAPFQVYEGLPD